MYSTCTVPSRGPNLFINAAAGLNEVDMATLSLPITRSVNVEELTSTSVTSRNRDNNVVLPCFCKPTNISFILSLGLALKQETTIHVITVDTCY